MRTTGPETPRNNLTVLALCLGMLVPLEQLQPLSKARLFTAKKDSGYFFKVLARARKLVGSARAQRRYNKKRMGKTVIMQFTARKRLYDHNIFLRALFRGQVLHRKYGNLKKRFQKPVMLDLGSAILFKGGAPTVRDLYEDKQVYGHLFKLVASDINDYRSRKTQFYNLYKRQAKKLPFKVIEIDMSLTRRYQFRFILKQIEAGNDRPLIFRTVNTGIDLFYTADQIAHHLHALRLAAKKHDLLYIMNRFLLFKPRESKRFEIVGTFDRRVYSSNHFRWRRINWKKRKVRKALRVYGRRLVLLNKKQAKARLSL